MPIPIVQRSVLPGSNPEVRRINTGGTGQGALAEGLGQAGRALAQGLSSFQAGERREAATDKRAHDAEVARMRRMVTLNAGLDNSDSTLTLQNEFDKSIGKDSLEAGEAALRSYDSNSERISGDIKDRVSRDAFELSSKKDRLLFRRHISAHQSTQVEMERAADEARSVDVAGQFAAKAAVRGDFSAAAEYALDALALLDDDEGTLQDSAESSIHTSIIGALLTDGQADRAKEYFDEFSTGIESKTRGKIASAISSSVRKVRAHKVSAELWAGSTSKVTGEPNLGRALEKLTKMSGKMHPDVVEKARENLIGDQKRKTEIDRLSDDPLTDILMLRFRQSGANVEKEQEFDELSYGGKIALLDRIIQNNRRDASASRAVQNFFITKERRIVADERRDRKDAISDAERERRHGRQDAADIRREERFDFAKAEREAKKLNREADQQDELEESRYNKLFVVNPDGSLGNDQMTVDLNKFAFSEVKRNEIEAGRTRMIESRNKLGGVRHKELLNTLESYIDDNKFNDGQAGRFRRDFFAFYHEWERTNRDTQTGGPSPDDVVDFLAMSHVGSKRKREDQGTFEKLIGGRTVPAFEIRAEGNVPAPLEAEEKDVLDRKIAESRDVNQSRFDAVGKKTDPLIIRYRHKNKNGDWIERALSVSDRTLVGKKRSEIEAAGWEIIQ